MKEVKGFTGSFDFLSNFYASNVEYNGLTYKNSEAAFQAQKTEDEEKREKFCELNPYDSKALGRKIKLRKDWGSVKSQIMYEVVKAKFTQNNNIKQKLIKTGDAHLEETNTWHDCIWGVCNCPKCAELPKQNLLGKILMRVREELKEENKKGEKNANKKLEKRKAE
jgi:ribA/ribD-fused uncharacterized protein